MALTVVFVVLAVGVVAEARRRYRRGAPMVLWAAGGIVLAATLNLVDPIATGRIGIPVAVVLFAVAILVGVGLLLAAARLGRAPADRR